KALPMGSLRAGFQMNGTFKELISILADNIRAETALSAIGSRFVEERHPVADGHLECINRREDLTLDTAIEKRPGILCRIEASPRAAAIQFAGNCIKGPGRIASALRFIEARTGTFAPRDLPGL